NVGACVRLFEWLVCACAFEVDIDDTRLATSSVGSTLITDAASAGGRVVVWENFASDEGRFDTTN
ncbi:hypothetical protein LCGC14_2544540, partial [marine sediment metagenome]